MTATSTKVQPGNFASAGRATGTASPGGPVPIPRVVGNRRIRTGGIALATMLLALGAALSGIALVSVSKTSSYLAVARPVSVGSQIGPADLTTVQISGGGGLTLIPGAEIDTVVGRHASVSLVPGTLLSPSELTDKTLIGSGQAQVGIAVHGGNLPTASLSPGEHIVLVPLGTNTTTDGPHEYDATIVDLGAPTSDGSVVMHIAVDADLAPTIVTVNASGGFGVILNAGN